jgi:hypothetical protein
VNFRRATREYETWLASHIRLLPADLRLKHQRMREGTFCFPRATDAVEKDWREYSGTR